MERCPDDERSRHFIKPPPSDDGIKATPQEKSSIKEKLNIKSGSLLILGGNWM